MVKSLSITFIFAAFFAQFLVSCSLKYDSPSQSEEFAPEFMFTEAQYITVEDGKTSTFLTAKTLERYKDGKATYGQNVTFKTFDKDGKAESEGKCGLLSSNSKNDTYVLYDDISITNTKEDISITADVLKWNGKSEQLTSDRNDLITVTKGKTIIQGSGFSASGISKKYSFTGTVTGIAQTDENQGEDDDSQEIADDENQ